MSEAAKRCECEVCEYGRAFMEARDAIPAPQQRFFDDMYERLCSVEDHAAHLGAILDGSWPSAVEQLERALVLAREKLA